MLKLHKILKVPFFLAKNSRVLKFPNKMYISRIKAQNNYKSGK